MAKIFFTDFFGVIVHDSGNVWLKQHGLFEYKKDYFPQADIGKITEQELLDNLSKLSGIPSSEIFDVFEQLAVLNEKTVEMLREIKKDCKIIVLSNCYEKALERRIKRFGIDDIFDDIVVSYKVGMIKPNKEIYEYAYKKYCKPGDEVFYIDDQEANLKVPKELGWKTLLFKEDSDLISFINSDSK